MKRAKVRCSIVAGITVVALAGCGAEAPLDANENVETLGNAATVGSEAITDRVVNESERQRMIGWLTENDVPAGKVRKRLRTTEGRDVSCVDVADQPSMRRLKLAAIERPPRLPDDEPLPADRRARPVPLRDAAGGEIACDAGTVPIPRLTIDDLRQFRTVDDFFRKVPSHLGGKTVQPLDQRAEPPGWPFPDTNADHEYAIVNRDVTNWGALSTMNIWRPSVELSNEFSLSQMWVASGTGSQTQTLEAGLQVYRNLYGDTYPHLFIYSTQDGYDDTGCYNNSCNDFVQTSSSVFPGQRISPHSTAGESNQWQTAMRWVKDGDSGSWWLWVEGGYVGYYPKALYNSSTGVGAHATNFQFGGEIVNKRNQSRHTSTDMGSGAYPSAGFGSAAYQASLRYFYGVDANGVVRHREATGMTRIVTKTKCYDVSYTSGVPGAGSTIYFGGPGHAVGCP